MIEVKQLDDDDSIAIRCGSTLIVIKDFDGTLKQKKTFSLGSLVEDMCVASTIKGEPNDEYWSKI